MDRGNSMEDDLERERNRVKNSSGMKDLHNSDDDDEMMDEEALGVRGGAAGSEPDPTATSHNEISALADNCGFPVGASDAERRRQEQLRSDEETARLLMEALAAEDAAASEYEQRRQAQLQADAEFARMLMESESPGFSAGHGASGPRA